MQPDITEEPAAALPDYARVPIAFEVRAVLDVAARKSRELENEMRRRRLAAAARLLGDVLSTDDKKEEDKDEEEDPLDHLVACIEQL